MKGLARFIATGAYAGYVPYAPGTVGTLVALPLAWVLGGLAEANLAAYWSVLGLIVAVSVWAAGVLARELGQHDPGVIVIDEVAGYLLAVALLPTTVTVLVVAFFVFRLLDILKPPPAAQAEALPGGLGVVADDLVAGLMTNLLVRLAIFFGLLV